MKKSIAASMIAAALALTCLLGLSGCERRSMDSIITNEPHAMRIDSGDSVSNTGLQVPVYLNESNGKYVNFYIENNGDYSILATINGQNERFFEAGEKGYVYSEVTQDFWGLDREYMCKVVAGGIGGLINVHYEITQDSYCYPDGTHNVE